ncbi:MAG: hypothetical protein FWG74_02450 [Planctomycetes bacterium]|nr:hypothetical protein [Planctomycetota bacterium]
MILETLENNATYYTLVPEYGLCRIDDAIINLRSVSVIRKLDGKTLVHHPGSVDPIILSAAAFDKIRDAVFAADDDDIDDEDYDDDDEE